MNISAMKATTMQSKAMQASVSALSEGRMGVTVPLRPRHFNNCKPLSVDSRLADRWGCQPTTAHARRFGPHAVNLLCADVIEVLLSTGQTEAAAAFESPVRAAMMGEDVPHWKVAQHADDQRDAVEDLRQAEWVHAQTDENLEAYIKAVAAHINSQEKLLGALIQEKHQRKETGA